MYQFCRTFCCLDLPLSLSTICMPFVRLKYILEKLNEFYNSMGGAAFQVLLPHVIVLELSRFYSACFFILFTLLVHLHLLIHSCLLFQWVLGHCFKGWEGPELSSSMLSVGVWKSVIQLCCLPVAAVVELCYHIMLSIVLTKIHILVVFVDFYPVTLCLLACFEDIFLKVDLVNVE